MNRTYGLLVAGALAAVAALVEALQGNTGALVSIATVVVLFPAAYALYRLLRLAARKCDALDFFSPLVAFPVMYVAWFAVGSIDLIDVPPTVSFGLFEPIPGYVIGYAALGLAAYLAGAAIGRPLQAGNGGDRTSGFTWAEDRFWAVSAGLGLLTLASYIYMVAGIGVVPALDADAGEIRLRIARYGGAEAVMFTGAWTLIPMLMMYTWYRRPGRGVKLLCFAGVAVVSGLLLSLGGRSYLFVPVLTTMVARHYGKRRFAIGKLALVSVTLFCGISLFGYVRDTSLNGSGFGEDTMGIPGAVVPFVYSYLYIRYPVATFRDITAIIPSKIPYQYGALSFGPLATVLPGRHEQSDMFFKNILGNDFIGAGQAATLLGPLYADAGLPGIVAGLFFSGMFITRAYAWMLAGPTVIRVLLYAWMMQTLLFSLFVCLFPWITTLWIPAFWMALHLFLRKPRGDGGSLMMAGSLSGARLNGARSSDAR